MRKPIFKVLDKVPHILACATTEAVCMKFLSLKLERLYEPCCEKTRLRDFDQVRHKTVCTATEDC